MEFKLPELGEGVHEGELVKWKVTSGETIRHDQPLCEIMTDKATMEIPAPFSGKITSLQAQEGKTVKVGEALLTYETGGAQAVIAVPTVPEKSLVPQSLIPVTTSVSLPSTAVRGPSNTVLAAPSTRRLAREKGIDLARVNGSGPHGRVLREDLERSVPEGKPQGVVLPSAPSAERREPFKGLRRKIAEKMRLSKDRAAHFTYVEEADATSLVELRRAAKEIGAREGIKVTYLPFIMKAMVASLRQFPILNSMLDDQRGELVYKHYFNIGLSIQTEDGLVAPVVQDVENKTILEIAREIQDLVDRARSKRLEARDFQGGTITLTNAGSIGGLFATPIINYPEVAILGFNKIFRKPVVKVVGGREEIVVRDWTYFSISLDHRVVDGAVGAEFMKVFITTIENPALLLLENF